MYIAGNFESAAARAGQVDGSTIRGKRLSVCAKRSAEKTLEIYSGSKNKGVHASLWK